MDIALIVSLGTLHLDMYEYMFPSSIRFSQEYINSYFNSKYGHANVKIGQTLDMLCDGTISIYDIPTIRVAWINGKYFTADNRRLWVFREMERVGKCSEIPVQMDSIYLPSLKYRNFCIFMIEVCKKNRIHHGWSVEIGNSQPEGPSVPVGNEARRGLRFSFLH